MRDSLYKLYFKPYLYSNRVLHYINTLLFWEAVINVFLLHFQVGVVWVKEFMVKAASEVYKCITTCSCNILSSKHFTRCLAWKLYFLPCTLSVKSGMCVRFLLCSVYEFISSICYVMLQISHSEAVTFTGPKSTVCVSPGDEQHVIITVANR